MTADDDTTTADTSDNAATDGSTTTTPASPSPSPSPSPTPTPAPTPAQLLEQMAEDLATAEARKPLEGPFADVFSTAADKEAARQKLKDAYTAASAANGPLKTKYDTATKSFNRAVLDMAAVPAAPAGASSALDAWLKLSFEAPGDLKKLLDERKDLASKVQTPSGALEKARADAQAKTKAWAARYADWSAPVDKIGAQFGQYADKIDKLNADINNEVNRMSAMTSFWFDVAPKHLQLAPDLDPGVKTAVDKVAAKLAGYDDLKDLLTIGATRFGADGSLYFVADGDAVEANRETVLKTWNAKAIKQAKAEAAFKLAPDDIASAKQRYDKLKDDGWIAEAKKIPEPT